MPYCPHCGATIEGGEIYCHFCGKMTANITAPTPELSPAEIPPEIKGWNWGAFFLTWIWGIGNRVWIALLCLIPYVGLVMAFVVGAKGNQWAWKSKQWDSVEQFKATQRKWAWWGLGIFLAVATLAVIAIIIDSSGSGD
ncbi:MAG: zinc ribbon domain-containing protein [Dehalococcoidia bacterium]|nr:zinc ribbon domain-containing protein [Dehalococcoidia bacterium]